MAFARALSLIHLGVASAVTFSRARLQLSDAVKPQPGKCHVPLTYREGRDCSLFTTEDYSQPYSNWDYMTGLCKTDYSKYQNGNDECLWQKCLYEKNPFEGAQQYMKNIIVDHASESEAAYCWATGMCTNPKLKVHSTIEDGEAVCDGIYGGAWRNLTVLETLTNSRGLAITACARGNYHCDAAYCKLYFCGDFWRGRYGFMDNKVKGM